MTQNYKIEILMMDGSSLFMRWQVHDCGDHFCAEHSSLHRTACSVGCAKNIWMNEK